MLEPISGAHFNPAVTAIFAAKRDMPALDSIWYILAQILGGLIGVWVAHLMFEEVVFQYSAKIAGRAIAVVCGIGGNVWAGVHDPCHVACEGKCCCNGSWALHYGCLLVYGIYIVCESCRHNRAYVFGYICRYPTT